MAGHSKWANIKHRKAAQDAKRGKVFTKLIRELTVAARMGGDDPTANPRLRAAVQTALSQNMTRDTIDRAIKRGAGGDDTTQLEEIRYEGYGPGGVALMVDCMTDNRNRTVAEVRHAFTKAGGNLGTDGSVSYLFSKQGVISFSLEVNEDEIIEVALEAGAEDVTSDEYGVEVITAADNFSDVKDALDQAGFEAENAEVTMIASTKADLDKDTAEKVLNMIERLEDLDDVQNVYSNAEISADVLALLAQ
ncbi:MAG: YebC/PmpR family DNA-binding transcriptional regulator [Gammaproteobacteria bacterium]|nr:MAG: YebC/PmpR family DNA-binding transcriptional regulator [Gammaproteobacteria bacterium]UTW42152.1 YebC/PmpR family DNA-binding transcriptional regulator [bacterium SCSIO 12844]